MQFQFQIPRCVCAPGASKTVGQLAAAAGLKKVLCIYDKGVKAAGNVDPVIAAMKETGIAVAEFDGVVSDPSVEVVEIAGDMAKDKGAEGIVAIGGGSAIDTAKVAAVLATNRQPVQSLYARGSIVNAPLPLYALPTTSGTGSEVTPAAVVSDPSLGRKITMVDSKLIPVCAVLDPELVLGLPRGITAATGMDTLAHAVESMTCIVHNPMTDGIALSAIRLIVNNLPSCVQDGVDETARGNMMVASTMAGMAFGNTAAHVGHAFAHAMGAVWHIPHGTACALALPFAIRNCAGAAHDRVLAIAETVGIAEAADLPAEELGDQLAAWFAEFAVRVGIPTLEELVGRPEELDTIVAATLNEKPLIQLSGVPVTEEACRAYYKKLFAM